MLFKNFFFSLLKRNTIGQVLCCYPRFFIERIMRWTLLEFGFKKILASVQCFNLTGFLYWERRTRNSNFLALRRPGFRFTVILTAHRFLNQLAFPSREMLHFHVSLILHWLVYNSIYKELSHLFLRERQARHKSFTSHTCFNANSTSTPGYSQAMLWQSPSSKS